MKQKQNNKRILKLIFFTILIYAIITNLDKVLSGLSNFLIVIAPFWAGLMMGYLFLFPVRNLEKLILNNFKVKNEKLVRGLIITFVYIIFFVIVYVVMSFIIPFLYNSAIDITQNLPQYINEAEIWFLDLQSKDILTNMDVRTTFNNIRDLDIYKIALDFLKEIDIKNSISKIFLAAGTIVRTFMTIVISVNVVVYSKKMSKESYRVTEGILGKYRASKIKRKMRKINTVFARYIYSQFIDGIIVAIITSIILLILEVKYAVAFGIIIGVGNFIPYVGALFSICITILVTFLSAGFSKAVIVGVSLTIAQQIDANIINPKIVGDNLDLNPALVMLAMIVGTKYIGGLSLFFASPILAIIKIMIEERIVDKKAEKQKQYILNMRKPMKLNNNSKNYKLDIVKNYVSQQEKQKIKNNVKNKKVKTINCKSISKKIKENNKSKTKDIKNNKNKEKIKVKGKK